MQTFRQNVTIPGKIYLADNFEPFIEFIPNYDDPTLNAISFSPNSESAFLIGVDGMTMNSDLAVPILLLPPTQLDENVPVPIQIGDYTQVVGGATEGFVIENGKENGDGFDLRFWIPRDNTKDVVFFNGFAGSGVTTETAILQLKKTHSNLDGGAVTNNNMFCRFRFGNNITENSVTVPIDYDIGFLMNINGPIGIATPNNTTFAPGADSAPVYDGETAFGVVNALEARTMTAPQLDDADWVGFYYGDVAGVYAPATYNFGLTDATGYVCEARLLPILWNACKYHFGLYPPP